MHNAPFLDIAKYNIFASVLHQKWLLRLVISFCTKLWKADLHSGQLWMTQLFDSGAATPESLDTAMKGLAMPSPLLLGMAVTKSMMRQQ
jgi:hypothetical protein